MYKVQYNLDFILSLIFLWNDQLSVVQIGANDGVMCDPLRRYLINHKGKILLIEAVPFYCEKLKELYKSKENVTILNNLISNTSSEKDFFYIDPSIASSMDGDGPNNQWAHGQGSIDKEVIISWIKKNSFRGENYRKNINNYIKSIKSIKLISKKLNDIANENDLGNGIDLLVLDVQGHEFKILENLPNIKKLPLFIIYEDDSSMSEMDSKNLSYLLIKYGYRLILPGANKVWTNIFYN